MKIAWPPTSFLCVQTGALPQGVKIVFDAPAYPLTRQPYLLKAFKKGLAFILG